MGYRLQFTSTPCQGSPQRTPHFDQHKAHILTQEVQDLVSKGAILKAPRDHRGFVSPIFLTPKADGPWRPVINLKALNRLVMAQHFKMESIHTVKGLIKHGDWLLKLDLKNRFIRTIRGFSASGGRTRYGNFGSSPLD